MRLEKTFIPYGAYWSSPFCRWQGRLAGLNSLELVAKTAARFVHDRALPVDGFDAVALGVTVPQRHGFYGAPWVAAMAGLPGVTGPTFSQACATSARVLASSALEIETAQRQCILTMTCDRTSNGPHIYYPDPNGPGGMGEAENPVRDNFNKDPHAGLAMIQTAENVVREAGMTRQQQDDLTVLRYAQYQEALANDRAFQRRYMFPVEVPKGKKETLALEADEGVFATAADGLAKLRPVLEGGSVTYGTQTFPADANAGIVACTREAASRLARDPKPWVQVVSYAEARVKKGFMPMASVPAARQALQRAGIALQECKCIKTHNPFAANDVYFCKEFGLEPERINHYGSPLIYGHPQAPMGMRVMIEVIEELVMLGGGYGVFSGCAAGDTAMAVVFKVG